MMFLSAVSLLLLPFIAGAQNVTGLEEIPDNVTYAVTWATDLYYPPIDWDTLVALYPGLSDPTFQKLIDESPWMMPTDEDILEGLSLGIASCVWVNVSSYLFSCQLKEYNIIIEAYREKYGYLQDAAVLAIYFPAVYVGNLLILPNPISISWIIKYEETGSLLQYLQTTMGAALALSCAVIVVFGSFGNGLTIASIFASKHMRTPTNILLGSLAIADCLSCLYTSPRDFVLYCMRGAPQFTYVYCFIGKYIEDALFASAVIHLVAVSFERYIAICHPMKAHAISSSRRTIMISSGIWMISMVIAIPAAYYQISIFTGSEEGVYIYQCGQLNAKEIVAYYTVVFFGVPVLLMGFSYISVAIALWKSSKEQKRLQASSKEAGDSDSKGDELNERIQVLIMLISLYGLFIVTWGPRAVGEPFVRYGMYTPSETALATSVTRQISQFNSMVNPIIYAITSKKFRAEYIRRLTCKPYKPPTKRGSSMSRTTGQTAVSHSDTN